MSRYKDADKISATIEAMQKEYEPNSVHNMMLDYALAVIDVAPTEDVVKVVHCRDCEHFAYSEELNKLHQCEDLGYCDYFDVRSDNCYCNFGEDKSDPNEIYFTEVRELVHGKWLIDRDGYYYCSRCFAKARWNHDRSMQCRTIYCPDCGANMEDDKDV